MLLVGDIHTTRKTIQASIDSIQWLVDRHPDDDVIVFVWDYVYHFSYDAVALHTLFSYWMKLVSEWKQLLILAWNHDRIHNQFVFAEWKMVFDMMNTKDLPWSILFITQPLFLTIQNQDILFFPYTTTFEQPEVRSEYVSLIESNHAKERLSWEANSVLHTMIDSWKETSDVDNKLLVIHHRYTAWISFPGQFARFWYSSPALSKHRLDDDRLMIISWHLHQPFIERNYLCVWSVRSTSPLEINQQKYLCRLDCASWSIWLHPVAINPYYQCEVSDIQHGFEKFIEQVQEQSLQHIQSWLWKVLVEDEIGDRWYDRVTLTIVSDKPWVLEEVDATLAQSLWSLRQKQSSQTLNTLITSMQESSKELDKNFSDRKTLLHEFLGAKYGERKEIYIDDLERLKIL